MKPFYLICWSLLLPLLLQSQSLNTTGHWLSQMPAAFEENKGQVWNTDRRPALDVQYHFQKANLNIFFLPTGMAYQFDRIHYPEGHESQHADLEADAQAVLRRQVRHETYRMDVELVGANPNAKITAEGKSQAYTNYYNRHALKVHRFQKLIYQDIYPGINWVIYTTAQGLKYDFQVQLGADPHQIRLRFKDHERLQLNADGSLTLSNRMGEVTEQAPISFQGGVEVATAFKLEDQTITFELDSYDQGQTLTIDPSIVWATYYGGATADSGEDCVLDSSGHVYMAGHTVSAANIAAGGHQNNYGGSLDAFLVKFDANGVRQWATYYGGTRNDIGYACAVGSMDQVYLAGLTESDSNIALNGAQDTYAGGFGDAFLVQFDRNGFRKWATYYGRNGREDVRGCTVSKRGAVYITGCTNSSSQLAVNGHQSIYGGGTSDAYLVKFNAQGALQWATYYGGRVRDDGYDCAVGDNESVYMSGMTASNDNIAFNGHQSGRSRGFDAFLAKFDSSGTRLWATYYGGNNTDQGWTCAVDKKGDVYLGGMTESLNNMASNGYQNVIRGYRDGFLAKFDKLGQRQWATYYGGGQGDEILGCALDTNGHIYLAGATESTDHIVIGGPQDSLRGLKDAFLLVLSNNGVPQWATYHGASDNDFGYNCAVDQSGAVYMAGQTYSQSGMATGGHQNTYGGGRFDAFLIKYQSQTCLPIVQTITQRACNSLVYDGITYTTSGRYSRTFVNAAGCDSTIVLDLTIASADTSLTQSGATFTATASNATYQWLACNNGHAPIAGATGQSFTPSSPGSYAVAVTENGCTDTSACFAVLSIHVQQIQAEAPQLQLYPNPTAGSLTIDLGRLSQKVTLQLLDQTGKTIREQHYTTLLHTQWTLDQALPSAVYILKITIENQAPIYSCISKY